MRCSSSAKQEPGWQDKDAYQKYHQVGVNCCYRERVLRYLMRRWPEITEDKLRATLGFTKSFLFKLDLYCTQHNKDDQFKVQILPFLLHDRAHKSYLYLSSEEKEDYKSYLN